MRHLGLSPGLFTALAMGVFMGALDLTIVAPALPQIGASLGVSPAAVVIAFSIYAAFYAVSVPVMGKLADIRGYAKIYRVSLLLFAGGSALAALSPSLPILVIARIIQGIGGGGLFPVAQAIVGTTISGEKQGRVLGILVGVFALGGVLGPNLGGFLTQVLSWRWIFWINVPIGAIGMLIIRNIHIPGHGEGKRVDWAGAILVAVALGSLVMALESLRHVERGLINPYTVGFVLATVAGFTLLIFVERRRSDPVVDVSFVASGSIAPLLVVSFLIGYALLAGVIFTPLYAQVVFDATTLASGAILNAAAAGLGLSSYVAGRLTGARSSRPLILVGMAGTATGLAVMIMFRGNVFGLLAGLILLGIGLGLTQGPLSYMGLTVAPRSKQGQISGLIAITRSMGGATGITLAGVLLSRAVDDLREAAFSISTADIWDSEGGGLEALDDISPEAADAVRRALVEGLIEGWYWALGAAVLGLVVAVMLDKKLVDADAA